jgi:large subunit ribosomal protein L21
MYAILQQSGHQYRVSPGDRLVIDRLTAEVGSVIALEPVVLVQNDDGTQVGTPVVEGARVAAVVVSHRKGAKIRVFKFKAKKRYRRTHGHRSLLTELRVEAVLAAGEPLPKAKVTEAKPDAAPAKRSRARSKTAAAEAPAAVVETDEAPAAAAAAAQTVADAPQAEAAASAGAATETEAPKRTPRSRARKSATSTDTPAAEGGETPES